MANHYTKRKTKTILLDRTGTPLALDLASLEVGDFSVSGEAQGYKATYAVKSRGAHQGLEFGDDSEIAGSFTVHQKAEYLNHSGAQRLPDFILKQGGVSGGVTANGADPDVWTIDIKREFYSDVSRSTKLATKLYADCRCTIDDSDGDPNSWKVSFTCYGGVTTTNED